MKTLTQHWQRVGRVLAVESIVGCAWLMFLVTTEVVGRASLSDVTDAVALLGVGSWLLLTAMVHWVQPLRPLSAIGGAIRSASQAAARWRVRWGVDFRQEPAIRTGFPWTWRLIVTGLTLMVVILTAIAPSLPTGARSILAPRFYLGYLTLVGALWSLLAFGILFHPWMACICLHDWFVERYRGQARRPIGIEVIAAVLIIVSLLGCAALLPVWIPLAVNVCFLGVATAATVASSPDLALVWSYQGGGPLRTFEGRWLAWLDCAISIAIAVVLTLVAGGEGVWALSPEHSGASAPVTLLLGRLFAWFSLGGDFVLVYCALRFAYLGIKFDPIRIRAQQTHDHSVGEPDSSAMRRRAEIQCRRQLTRGLQKLFRRAARQSGRRGTGLWLGIQHWYILGLARDHDDSSDRETTVLDEIIGPPYHRVFSKDARFHFWLVCKALQIDLMFVENGVGVRSVVAVLRMMFEIYDVHGGRKRAEEWHFAGIPKVRTMIHQFEMTSAMEHGREGYPEPDYDEVGRARILHVFKDRGEACADEPLPESWEDVPVGSSDDRLVTADR